MSSVQYFAKVTDMNHETTKVAIAQTEKEQDNLRKQGYEPCSRTFYESVQRTLANRATR